MRDVVLEDELKNTAEGVLDSFLEFELDDPGKPFLHKSDGSGNWSTLTRSDVGRRARQLAQFFRQSGIRKGARTGILSDNSPDWCIADLALAAVIARICRVAISS